MIKSNFNLLVNKSIVEYNFIFFRSMCQPRNIKSANYIFVILSFLKFPSIHLVKLKIYLTSSKIAVYVITQNIRLSKI